MGAASDEGALVKHQAGKAGLPVTHLRSTCLPDQHTFYVGQDSSRSVACMVDSSLGVWVTLKGSAHVCLYHPDTFEQLAEVDVTPPVHRMLAGTDLSPPLPLPLEPFRPIVETAEPGPGSTSALVSLAP